MTNIETSEFFHPLLIRFDFELVKSFVDDLTQHYLYRRGDIEIITTEGTFGSYWQKDEIFGSWAILEDYLTEIS